MARIPTFTEGSIASLRNLPRAQTPQAAPALDFSSVQRSLGSVLSDVLREGEIAAETAVRERAVQTQAESDALVLAGAPPELAPRFARAFQDQARAVQMQQLENQSQIERARLAEKNRLSPEQFAVDWADYSQSVADAVSLQDPAQAAQAGLMLDRIGVSQEVQLFEAKAAHERNRTTVEYMATQGRRLGEAADELLRTADYPRMYETLVERADSWRRAYDSGMITAEQLRANLVADEWPIKASTITGDFEQSLERGDINGAVGIVEALNQGKWFEDNEDALRLANRLAARLQASKDSGLTAGNALKIMRTENVRTKNFGLANDQAMQNAYNVLVQTGTDSQLFDGVQQLNLWGVTKAVSQAAQTGSREQLESLKQQLLGAESTELLPAGGLSGEVARVNKRIEDINEATAEGALGDVASLIPPLDWANLAPAEIAARQRERRQTLAGITGLPPDSISPWSQSDRESFDLATRSALQQGDAFGAVSTIDKYLAPADGEIWAQRALAAQGGSFSGPVQVAMLLRTVTDGTQAQEALNLAEAGRRTEVRIDPTLIRELFVDEDVRKAIVGIAGSNVQLMPEVQSTVEDMVIGAMAQVQLQPGQSESAVFRQAKDRVLSVLAETRDVQEFDNGYTLPKAFLANHEAGQEEVTRQINEAYSGAVAAFYGPEESGAVQFVAPEAFEKDSVVFRDTRLNVLLADPENPTQPLKLFPPQILEETGLTEEPPSIFDQAVQATQDFFAQNESARAMRSTAVAAQFTGTAPENLSRITRANLATPVEEFPADIMLSGNVAYPMSALSAIDEQAVRAAYKNSLSVAPEQLSVASGQRGTEALGRARADSIDITHADLAPFVLAEYVKVLEAKFPGEPDKVAAAARVGIEPVERAVETFGADWKRADLGLDKYFGRLKALEE